jgi:hypothetical protein
MKRLLTFPQGSQRHPTTCRNPLHLRISPGSVQDRFRMPLEAPALSGTRCIE